MIQFPSNYCCDVGFRSIVSNKAKYRNRLEIDNDMLFSDPIHLPKKHLPEIAFPQKTLGRNYIIPNTHFPERAFSRNYIFLNVQFPKFTLGLNMHLPEITLARMLIWPKLIHFPESLFSRIYTCRKFTLGRNCISPKAYFPEFTLARLYI